MKRNSKKIYFLVAITMIFLAACGVFFDDANPVDQPASVNAGDTLTVVLHAQYKLEENVSDIHNIAAILVPKSWNAANNSIAYFTSTVSVGPQKMSVVPATELPPGGNGLSWANAIKAKFGFGTNVLTDMEWIVFKSDNGYNVNNGQNPTADITIKVKTGPENMQYKPGYFISQTRDGFNGPEHYKVLFKDCFMVTNGTGDLIDFCFPQIGTAEPSKATKDDIVTLKYDGALDATTLKDAGDIYLCATAYTTDGQAFTKCQANDASSKLKSYDLKKWRIDIWPSQYFGIPANKELQRIEYFLTDVTGMLKTGYGNTAAPFVYKFKCN